MYLYYPLLNLDDKVYDCSGSFDSLKDAKATNFPVKPIDSLYFNIETVPIPVSSYFSFTGTSKIESDNIINFPPNFTITFWMIKSISSPTVQTIFRAGGFRIYVVSTTLYIEYNGVYYTIPITLGKWGFFTIRQGEVDVYNYNITEPIESNKRILHISSSFINDEFSPITYTENTTSGGPDFVGNLPSIYDKTSLLTFGIENIQADFVFARNLLNLTEKDALFSSEITGNKFYLLENFVGTVVEFRIWDKLVDDYKKRVIERGSYIFSGEGDLSQNIVNIKARIENIREVDSSKEGVDFNGEKSSFMHAQSVSTLSTHNEFLKGELFSIETKNSSFPTQETNLDIALTTLGIPLNYKELIFSKSENSFNSFPLESGGYLTNTAITTQNAYIKEFSSSIGITLVPGNLYYVQVTYLVDSPSCESIKIYSDDLDNNFIAESIPSALEQKTAYGIIKANSNGELFIQHNYPIEFIGNIRNLAIFDILCIDISENGIYDFLDENGYINNNDKSLNLFLTFKKPLDETPSLRYLQNFSSGIRIFPTIQEEITNLANVSTTTVSPGTEIQESEDLYNELTSINPGTGNPLYQDLNISEDFVNSLRMTESMKTIIWLDKYYISRPDNNSFITSVSPDDYKITFTGLDTEKEYFFRIVSKNISQIDPAYEIQPCSFNHLTSTYLMEENGNQTGVLNPLVLQGIDLSIQIPEEYVADLPIDDIDIFFAITKPDVNGEISFDRYYSIEPDLYPELKIISIYDITLIDIENYLQLEKNVDISYLKEQIISSDQKQSMKNAVYAYTNDINIANYYEYGIDQWIKGILLSSIVPYIIPTVDSENENKKTMEVEFYPKTRRKKYTIFNLQHNGVYSTEKIIPSGSTILMDYSLNNFDSADKLVYFSYDIKSNTGGPITATLRAKDALGNTLGKASTKTITSSSFETISILIKEGWNKSSNNKIKTVVLEVSGSCIIKNSVECNLTDYWDVENWLSSYNLRTLTYKDGYDIKVNTDEKKALWCDMFLKYDFFIPGNGYLLYNMASPNHVLKTSELAFQQEFDASENKGIVYNGYIAELTAGETDSPISNEDFFPVAWMHRNGSTDISSGKLAHGVGIIAGEIIEVKDVE